MFRPNAYLSRSQFLSLAGGSALGALSAGLLSGCGSTISTSGSSDSGSSDGGSKVLNLYTWQEYVPPKVVEGFQEETGITINYSYFSTCEEMLAKLEATGGADYDVILTTDYSIKIAADEGLLQKIDASKLSNLKNVDPRLQKQYFDPDGDLSIPYWISSAAILFNPARTNLSFESFADLADPSLAGNVVVTDSERDIIGTAIVVSGGDFNTQDVNVIKGSKEFLDRLRPSIKAFNTDSPEFVVTNGDAIASYHTGAQAVAGVLADPSLKFTYPKESTTLGIDAFVVPSQAPNLDNVYTFLDYVLRPEVAATAVEHTHYHSSNSGDGFKEGIQEYVDQNSVAIIPDEILDNYQLNQSLTADAQKAYDDLWTEFKQGA